MTNIQYIITSLDKIFGNNLRIFLSYFILYEIKFQMMKFQKKNPETGLRS